METNTAAARRPTAWPFMAPTPPHSRQEVEFLDGKRLWLRPIVERGEPSQYLRELGEPAEGVRVDLRNFLPELVRQDYAASSPREYAAYIARRLRRDFATREAFIEAAVRTTR